MQERSKIKNLNHQQEGNEVKEIVEEINEKVVENEVTENGQEMICPKCGSKLVLRTARKGSNAGNKFYGCSAFPKCRYIQTI